MADNSYWPGQRVRIKTTTPFAVNGVNTDPTAVSLLVKAPSGTVTTYTWAAGDVTRVAAGDFYMDLDIGTTSAAEGEYAYAFRGTGAVVAADEGRFTVRKSMVRA